MVYKIIWAPRSRENIKKPNRDIAKRVIKKITELELAPYHFVEKITDANCWKCRVGDYRILLDINEKKKEIHVLKVGHRKNIYKT